MRVVRLFAAVALAGAALVGLSALSQLPYEMRDTGALLRLSWRVRGETIESCRRATAEELAGVEAHMRQEVICEGRRVAPYRLRVAIDGRLLTDTLAPGSGVRGDRPMHVLRDIPLAPGPHRIVVSLERQGPGAVGDTLQRREHERRAIPPRLGIDTMLAAAPNEILLVTYAPDERALELVGRRGTRDERRETRDERRETRDERRETRDEGRGTRDEGRGARARG